MGTEHEDQVDGTRILPHVWAITPGSETAPLAPDGPESQVYVLADLDLMVTEMSDCQVYAVDTGEQVVLVDAGRGDDAYPLLVQRLERLGLWSRVSLCLITHAHQDHAGGANQLRADGVQVWGHPGLQAWPPGGPLCTRVELDRGLQGGEIFCAGNVAFQVLATPGHTSTCLTYLADIDGRRCAFTGDLVAPGGMVGAVLRADFDRDRLERSLAALAARDFTVLFGGHYWALDHGQSWPAASLANMRAGDLRYR